MNQETRVGHKNCFKMRLVGVKFMGCSGWKEWGWLTQNTASR